MSRDAMPRRRGALGQDRRKKIHGRRGRITGCGIAAVAVLLVLTACQSDPPHGLQTAGDTLHTEVWLHGIAGERETRVTDHSMVAAANPIAASAGRFILRQGGSAIDAAVAVQMVLTLVEPQSSGIGGGGFLLHYDADTRTVAAFDGRETAPASATADMFLRPDGTPMDFYEAVVGGLSVGVPGLLRMLELAHRDHGRLPWHLLFDPAIELAERGFPVSPRLHNMVAADPYLGTYPEAAAYFYDGAGRARAVGTLLTNRQLADTLRRIADGGADAFYEGPLAGMIVSAVHRAGRRPGAAPARMVVADLAAYTAHKRQAICRPYRAFQVCGMPPPTSGGVAVLQMLGILEGFDMAALDPVSTDAAHLIAEAGRLAFADRNAFLADSDFVDVPIARLLGAGYLATRRNLIDMDRSLGEATPGLPLQGAALHADTEGLSTSHLSIVDQAGDAVSFTTSIENAFGSRVMVGGFLLNNQLTDFSFRPAVDGRPVANRVEPGKRPRSSMSPTLVLHDGVFEMAVGSPGGSRIIGYTARALSAALDNGLSMADAVSLPHVVNRNGPTDLEADTAAAGLEADLAARGHEVRVRTMTSGLHAIRRLPDGRLQGGADPRREGIVLGD